MKLLLDSTMIGLLDLCLKKYDDFPELLKDLEDKIYPGLSEETIDEIEAYLEQHLDDYIDSNI